MFHCCRAQIIDDAINLAKSGHLDYQTALSVTGYLSKEVEYVPWVSALNGLSYINTMLKRTSAYGEFKKSVVSFNEQKEAKRILHFQVHAASRGPHLQETWLHQQTRRHSS